MTPDFRVQPARRVTVLVSVAVAVISLLSACTPTLPGGGTTTTLEPATVPLSQFTWTHAAADDRFVDVEGVTRKRAETRTDENGAYYPVGAVLPSAIEWDGAARSLGRLVGGTLGDLKTLAAPLFEQISLPDALASLTPAERDDLATETLATSGVAGSTWSTALGGSVPDTHRTWSQVLAASTSPDLQAVSLSELSIEDSPMRRVELGALVLRNARLGDLPLGSGGGRSQAFEGWCAYLDSCAGLSADSTVGDLHLRGIPMRRVPIESVPMRRVDPTQLGELMSVPMRRVDPSKATGLASIPMRRVDLAATSIGTIPMRRVDLVKLGISGIPMRRVDLAASPLGAIVVGSVANPGSLVTCLPTCASSTLAQVQAAGNLQPGATMANLESRLLANDQFTLASLFPFLTAEPGAVDPTVGDLIRALPDDAYGNGFTIGQFLPGLPADDLPGDGAFDHRATLGDLLEGVIGAEGVLGSLPTVNYEDALAVRLDLTTEFTADRTSTIRLRIELPTGGRTEVESPEVQGVFAVSGPSNCPQAGTQVSAMSAMGEFDLAAVTGCRYSMKTRVSIPIRYTSAQVGLRVTNPQSGTGWDASGPEIATTSNGSLSGTFAWCTAEVQNTSGTSKAYDCGDSPRSSGTFLSFGYLEANQIAELPHRSAYRIRRLDGGSFRLAVTDQGSSGGAVASVGATPTRPARPAWVVAAPGFAERMVASKEADGWISADTDISPGWRARLSLSATTAGWYVIEHSTSTSAPQMLDVSTPPPSENPNCADFTPLSVPNPFDDFNEYGGTVVLFNYGGTYARYGRARTLALWDELQAFRAAGLGKTYVGASRSDCSTSGTGSSVSLGGAIGTETIVLGGFDLVPPVDVTTPPPETTLLEPLPGVIGPWFAQANLEDGVTIGSEATYGPFGQAGLSEPKGDVAGDGDIDDNVGNRIGRVGTRQPGRLVETPEEIAGQLRAFRLSATRQISSSTSLVAGYDFLTDSSTKTAARLNQLVPPVDQSLINETWTAAQLESKLTQAPTEGVSVVNAHFDHTALLSAAGNAGSGDVLTTSRLISQAGTSLSGTMVITVGCHSGLPVPDYRYPAGSPQALDWPQAMAKLGVPVFVASIGYGYGDTDVTAFSERLEELFVQQLGYQETVGRALYVAKRLYLAERPELTAYDAKVVLSYQLFGIPNWKTPGPRPKPAFTDLPTVLSASSSTTTVGAASAASGLNTGVLARPFTFSPRVEADAAAPGGIRVRSTPRGPYVAGADGDLYVSPGKAVLPAGSVALPDVAGKEPVGVLIDSVAGTVLGAAADPLVSTPVLGGEGSSATSPSPTSPNRLWDLGRSMLAGRLNLVAGRFVAGSGSTAGRYSVFTGLSGRVLYADSGGPTSTADRTPPSAQVTSSLGTVGFLQVPTFGIAAQDPSGIWLIRATYRTASGGWVSVTSTPTAGTTGTTVSMTGSSLVGVASGPLDAFIQVVDRAGNVATINS